MTPAPFQRAFDFVVAAEKARTIPELDDAMHGAVAPFGVKCFALLGMAHNPDNGARTPVRLGEGCHPQWVKYYEGNRCYNHDIIIHHALRNPNSFSWTDVEPGPMPEASRALFAPCRDVMGVDGGFIVPMFDALGFAGVVALFHEQHQIEESAKKPLRLIALYAAERAREIRGIESGIGVWQSCPLTQRQREMLAYSANGKSDGDVSQIIGRSEKTVNHHFERAKKILGVKTRAQAVAIAVHHGWVAL